MELKMTKRKLNAWNVFRSEKSKDALELPQIQTMWNIMTEDEKARYKPAEEEEEEGEKLSIICSLSKFNLLVKKYFTAGASCFIVGHPCKKCMIFVLLFVIPFRATVDICAADFQEEINEIDVVHAYDYEDDYHSASDIENSVV
ncbi:hypothetical protein L1887_41289 [Cichorium endivia]|nr:hypothetical protein L1887_41289 [Cichorium endivia]